MSINTAQRMRWFLGVALGFLGSGMVASAGESDYPARATTEFTQATVDREVRAIEVVQAFWTDLAARIGGQASCPTHPASIPLDARIEERGVLAADWIAQDARVVPDSSEVSSLASWDAEMPHPHDETITLPSTINLTLDGAPNAGATGRGTRVYEPPYNLACFHWGEAPGWSDVRHSCNSNTGAIGTFAHAIAGGAVSEAMQKIFIYVESPCEITFDATIKRFGGTTGIGIAWFAGTAKSWSYDNFQDNYHKEFVDPPLSWDRLFDLCVDFASLLGFAAPAEIAEIIDIISQVNDIINLIQALDQLISAGDAEVLHVNGSFWATEGSHTIYVGLRSECSAFLTGYGSAMSAGIVESIEVSGSGLQMPPGICCYQQVCMDGIESELLCIVLGGTWEIGIGSCPTSGSCRCGEINDCVGHCAPADWVGDDTCDEGQRSWHGIPIYLDCAQHDRDGSDCCECEIDAECNDGNPCTNDWCDCECYHSDNSIGCDDGVFCNGDDSCSGGTCSDNEGNPCAGGGPCNNTCNEAPENCYSPNGTQCEDDGNECTYDQCDGQGSCVHPAKPNGTSCAGGQGECVNGVCAEPDINCEELDGHYFGSTAVETCSPEHTWEIVNTGDAILNGAGQGITLCAGDVSHFELTQGADQSCFPLAPQQSCTVGVCFCPESEGNKACTLCIESEDDDESPCEVTLTGKGVGFGDCSDGNVTLDPGDPNTCILDDDPNVCDVCVLEDHMNYRNLTVPSGITLDTHGYTVKVCETLVNNGVITDNWSGGGGGDGGAGGKGDNPWNNSVPAGCDPRDDDPGCATDGLGEDGESGGAGDVGEAGGGGQGGGGGGGGGGAWHWLTQADADGGNGGAGGKGGKGGGYVKVYAYRFDNQGEIHADGFPGKDGGDAPLGDEESSTGYEDCGAEYYEFVYLLLLRDLSGGGGGGGGGGAGGDGGTVDYAYYERVQKGEIRADGGQPGEGGAGGSRGGDCVHKPIFGGANYPCGDDYCGCYGGAPNGGRGGGGGLNGDGGDAGIVGATPGALGPPGSGGEEGTVNEPPPECSEDEDCDDGLYCTGVEHCVAEVCQAGTPHVCDDGVDCTTDWCHEAADPCRYDLEPGYCLIGSVCYLAGTMNPMNDCEECDPALNTLDWSPRLAGVLCGDHDTTPCTNPDTCDGTGLCQLNHKPDDTPCADGLFCNGNEVCISGECQPGEPPLCDDGIACTEDSCDEVHDTCASVLNDDLCPGAELFCSDEICEPEHPDAGSNGCVQLQLEGPCVPGEVCDEDSDSCLPDCNLNSVSDAEDISGGTSQDCNANAIPDECDIVGDTSEDCQPNSVPDECDLATEVSLDCNANDIPDECDIAWGRSEDCQPNLIPDECDLNDEVHLHEGFEGGLPAGWSATGLWHVTDQCARSNYCERTHWAYYGQDTSCDFDVGTTAGVLTAPAISLPSTSVDSVTLSYCSAYNGEAGDSPDEWDAAWVSVDGIEVDDVSVEGTQLTWETRTVDLTPYAGQTIVLTWNFDSQDATFNNQLGWQIDMIAVVATGTSADCNNNSVPDECDIAAGTSPDTNGDGIPDECQCGVIGQQHGDSNGDGSINSLDIDPFVEALVDPAQYNIDYAPLLWECTADINADGSMNSLDIDPFVLLIVGG